MDKGLFAKHAHLIGKREESKVEIISLLKETIGITVQLDEISLSKKDVKFNVSSVKRAKLIQAGSGEILKSKGYRAVF